ncbi:MAG: Rieske 2Fe-2S domain-containing protein [Actinomycetota bacterium]|nr:Rieske 2Fe-2S domain-containing protein [Actinomycetota bacterium]MEC9424991.1 Rieske 2Fe-2S domain-containing protein [Actinomycetota bacterium]MEC9466934.1 Rieske 2Fe-2S domain-containing protein [Actinomycetota bacterium]
MAPGEGWVQVAEAVPERGAIVEASVERSGRTDDLVVWTTASGVPCVSEARCPHQWSHLAHEGAVDGEEIVCVSHFWRFGTDGEGWKQNVNGRRDRKGDLEVLPCEVHDGAVWVRAED